MQKLEIDVNSTDKIVIMQDPIKINEKRKELTKSYSKFHYGIDSYLLDDPKAIIIHATATPTYRSAHNSFYEETLKGRQDIKIGGEVNVSAHYIIDRDGTIYQQAPLDFMCRHAIGYNYTAIGIENVSTPESLLTEQQVGSNAHLIEYLVKEKPTISIVFPHKDYGKLPQAALVKAVGNPGYIPKKNPKQDPYGNDFERIWGALKQSTKQELTSRKSMNF